MPRLQRKSFSTPDEVRSFASGCIDVIRLDDVTIGRFALRPGWRWSKDVKPVVRTRSCQLRHVGYVMSGTLKADTLAGLTSTSERSDGKTIERRFGEKNAAKVTLHDLKIHSEFIAPW